MRSVDFEGVVTCSPNDSLSSIFSLIKIRRVHRLIVVAGKDEPTPGALIGVISLSDIMKAMMVSYLLHDRDLQECIADARINRATRNLCLSKA